MAKAYLDCLSREEAQRLWRRSLTECGYFAGIPSETVDTAKACGRVTLQCEYAKRSVPHYNGAAMDGIAVRASDTFGAAETNPRQLRLLAPNEVFQEGCCYIVDTGDPLPTGTNAVVMREDINISGRQVEVIAAAVPWQHVRIIGEDIVMNEMVLPEHHLLAPVDIAALLAAGAESLQVIAKPKVTVIPTGDELVARGADLKSGKILDVNSHMLCALTEEWGAVAYNHQIVPDDRAKLKKAIEESLAASDMVITNAGTSAGTEDFTAGVLAELGQVLLHGVSIKPGKPVILAICKGKPVVGLPGYPVSAALTAELFVKPILLERQKLPPADDPAIEARLTRRTYSQIGTEEYVRVSVGQIDGRTVAVPLARGAGLITSLTKAGGMMAVDAAADGIDANSQVRVRLLRGGAQHTLLATGSHDLSLDILSVYLKRRAGLKLACANVGSMAGIMAIRNREAHIAGIHILDTATGEYNLACVQEQLDGREWTVVKLAAREQGIIVAAGNPKRIGDLRDLMKPGVTFINRQRGSGTRMLLDYELARQGITARDIAGYEQEVGTHMAVAASVYAGAADAGLGIRAAANALGLDFIPIGNEQYDLLFGLPTTDPIVQLVVKILETPEFRREVEKLGGYDLKAAGIIRAEGKQHGD